MRYRLEVLSPIHIGNGLEISPMEYVVDDSGFYRVDMDSLFRDKDFNIDDFIKNTELDSFYLGEFYGGIAKRHKRYVLEVSDSAKNSMRVRKTEVREFIKTGGGVYIPGSSIKGAIRTAFLWSLLNDESDIRYDAERYIRSILSRKIKKPDRRFVDNEIEKNVFGRDPTHDFFKALKISDTNILPYNSLNIDDVHILTTRRYGYGWKNFNIILETLDVGRVFNIDISMDRYFMKESFSNSFVESLEDLNVICNEFSRDFIDYELEFFNEYNIDKGLDNIIKFYEDLKKENGVLLHISWGSGWHGMTIGRLFDEDIIWGLRRLYNLGRRRNPPDFLKPFPKTRKLVFDNGKPIYPLGWIKLEEIE